MASWRSTMAPPSARTAVSPLAVATGCFSAAIRAAKRLRCCEASSRLATAAVLSPSPGSATCCPEFRRTPSRGLVNYCPTAGNRSLVQPRSELRLYHSIHATGMRFTSRLPWPSRTRDQHLAQIRQHTGWRPATGGDKVVLEAWLREQAAYRAHTSELLFDVACQRFYEHRIELPTEGELRRLVNAALNGFYQDIHRQVAESLSPGVRKSIEQLLVVPESETISPFERL